MADIEEIMPVFPGRGCTMRMFIDHSKPADDPDYNWSETSYDGEEDSDVLSVPPHWHQYHDEVMEVLSGRLKFYVDGKEIIVSEGDPPLTIRRGSVHGFTVIKGESTTFKEKTNPTGEFKSLLFHDIFQDGNPSFALVMRAFYDGDTYISLPGNIKLLDRIFITVVGFVSKAFAPTKPTALKRKGEEREITYSANQKGGWFL